MVLVAWLKAVVRWVNFDRANRRQFASELVECVRFALMSIDQMMNYVEPAAAWLFTDPADWKRLYDAMKSAPLSTRLFTPHHSRVLC